MKNIIVFIVLLIFVACSKASKKNDDKMKAKTMFDTACELLQEPTNRDSLSAGAILMLKTIMIDYPKTKLAKSLELEVTKIPVYNSNPLSFEELIELDKKIRSNIQENKNEMIANLMNFGASSMAYYRTPITHGGGGRESFAGLTDNWLDLTRIAASMNLTNITSKYRAIELTHNRAILQGESKYWKIRLQVDNNKAKFKIISIKRK